MIWLVLFKDTTTDDETMLAENKDDDPVTFKVFNAFQKEIFKRFDAMQKQLDDERKAREEEKAVREKEKAAREEEKKRREEAEEEIWNKMVEYNLLGAVKKTILLHCNMFMRVKVDWLT